MGFRDSPDVSQPTTRGSWCWASSQLTLDKLEMDDAKVHSAHLDFAAVKTPEAVFKSSRRENFLNKVFKHGKP